LTLLGYRKPKKRTLNPKPVALGDAKTLPCNQGPPLDFVMGEKKLILNKNKKYNKKNKCINKNLGTNCGQGRCSEKEVEAACGFSISGGPHLGCFNLIPANKMEECSTSLPKI
jgi:hypothetical protein